MSECYTDKIFVMWSRPLVYASYWGATLLVGGALACATLLITLRKYDKDQTSVGRMIQTAFFAGCAGLLLFARSEEHTSELQSLMRISYAVFCLKKKRKI